MSDIVETRRVGRILIISMRRDKKRNAVNRELADAIDAALNELDDDPEIWAGVLTGTTTVFSAGSDLTANRDYFTERGGEYGIIRRNRRKPLIAAVEGPALGGGLEIVMACDLVVASASARFGLPEVAIGTVPACAGLFRAPRALPLNLANELILTGRPISAERAYAAGFVNVLSEEGNALESAIALAETICTNAPLSVQACLEAMREASALNDSQAWEATERAITKAQDTEDRVEGFRAFLEKRDPQWRGR